MLQEALKNKNGITLIALVITIIVLLILAGVTIAAITGNESAPNKAVEARTKNEQGAEFDAIKLAAASSVAEGNLDLFVDIPTLKAGLQGIVTDDLDTILNPSLSEWTVTGNSGVKYLITNRGMVTLASTVDIERNGEIVTDETLTFAASAAGSTVQLIAQPTADLALNSQSWGSSSTSVATVSNTGLVTIAGGGETTITLTAETTGGNFTKTVTIKVAQAVSSMTLSTTTPLSVKAGQSGTITVASITPSTNVEDIVFEIDTTNAAGAYFGTAENPTTSTTVPVGSGATASATINIPSNATEDAQSTVTIKGASSGAGSVTCTVKVAPSGVKVGDPVNYSTSHNGVTLNTWKVFHKDTTNDYVWIILSDNLPYNAIGSISGLAQGTAGSTAEKSYCVKARNTRTNLINGMGSSNWTSLKTGTLDGNAVTAVDAMGSPTLDLWQASWNDNHAGTTNDLFTSRNSTGYLVKNGIEPGSSDYYASMGNTGTLADLYFPHTSEYENCNGYWLASPSARSVGCVMLVTYKGYVNGGIYDYASSAFRPVVCLPSSVFE